MSVVLANSIFVNVGVSHGDDIIYIFSNPLNRDSVPKLSYLDERMKDILLNILVTFCSDNKPAVKFIIWEPVTKNLEKPLMQLAIKTPADISMQDSSSINRHRAMWESIPFIENDKMVLRKK
ncbi:esterase, partial [Oryctes borbonicus]